MQKLWDFLSGKKTYIAAAASVAYAGVGWWAGTMDPVAAKQMIETAVLGATIRHGIGGIKL